MMGASRHVFLMCFLLAIAQSQTTRASDFIQFDIPRQSLGDALIAFGRDANLHIVLRAVVAEKQFSTPVYGRMRAGQALQAILAGTNLRSVSEDDGTIVIVKVEHALSPPSTWHARSKETIRILGRKAIAGAGMMVRQTVAKTRSELTRDYILKQSPTMTPAALSAGLPGVQADDQGGLSVGNDTMHLRGLDQSELGYIFEGVPYSNPFTYDPNTASVIDDENIHSISISQGSVDLTAPLWNADGAEVVTQEEGPRDTMRMLLEGTGGTHSLQKEFIRLDSGYLGASGIKAFASYSFSAANLWRGPGAARRWHLDSGVDMNWGRANSSNLLFSWNQQAQTSFETPTLAEWHQYGDGYNYSASYTTGSNNYFAYNMKPTTTYVVTLRNHVDLVKGVTLDAQPYFLSAPGAPESMSTIPYSNGYLGAEPYAHLDGYDAQSGGLSTVSIHPNTQQSSGLNATIAWRTKFNILSLSYWYSYVTHSEYDEYYPLDPEGNWSRNEKILSVDGGQSLSSYNINGFQQINAVSIDDKLSLWRGKLSIDAGVKFIMLTRKFSEDLPAAADTPSESTGNIFVPTPQVLISYNLDKVNQIYGNFTSGFHAPKAYTTQVAAYAISTGRASNYQMPHFDPEYMIGEELGYRHSGSFIVNFAAFNYNLTHHQVSSQSYAADSSYLTSQTIDAGEETARGVQIEMGSHPWHHLSVYASAQYMHTSVDNNIATSGDYLPTKGNDEVGSPKLLAALGLSYEDGKSYLNFNFRYTDSQYATLMNDESIPSYFTADMSVGRNLPTIRDHIFPKIQLNLINLGDVHYLSSVTGYSLTAYNRTAINGTHVSASAPTYTVGSGFTMIASLTVSFN